jgi:hypothetical protein
VVKGRKSGSSELLMSERQAGCMAWHCSHSYRHTDPCVHAFWSIPGPAFSQNQRRLVYCRAHTQYPRTPYIIRWKLPICALRLARLAVIRVIIRSLLLRDFSQICNFVSSYCWRLEAGAGGYLAICGRYVQFGPYIFCSHLWGVLDSCASQ